MAKTNEKVEVKTCSKSDSSCPSSDDEEDRPYYVF